MDALTGQLTSLIETVPAWAVYLIAFGVVFLETAVIFIGLVAPSEALLIAAGVLELIGAFHFTETRAKRFKDVESSYRARFTAFANKPV